MKIKKNKPKLITGDQFRKIIEDGMANYYRYTISQSVKRVLAQKRLREKQLIKK